MAQWMKWVGQEWQVQECERERDSCGCCVCALGCVRALTGHFSHCLFHLVSSATRKCAQANDHFRALPQFKTNSATERGSTDLTSRCASFLTRHRMGGSSIRRKFEQVFGRARCEWECVIACRRATKGWSLVRAPGSEWSATSSSWWPRRSQRHTLTRREKWIDLDFLPKKKAPDVQIVLEKELEEINPKACAAVSYALLTFLSSSRAR